MAHFGLAGAARPHSILARAGLSVTERAILLGLTFAAALLYALSVSPLAETVARDPHLYTVLAGAVAASACGTLALIWRRNRALKAELRRIGEHLEVLSDRNWELKEAEERTRRLLEAQGDMIVRRDREGRITYANDAFCDFAGQPRETLIRSTFVFPVLDQGEVVTHYDGTRVHDQRIDTAAGPCWVAWRDVMVRDADGGRPEMLSVGRDVSDRVDAERALAEARDQAEAANRAKSRFLAMVSHEIRTPLNGILGMTGLILDTPLTPEQTTYATAVRTSGDTLLALIEEILDFSKIEAGKLDLDARPFALTALTEELVELLAPRAQEKGLEIASYVDERLADRVVGDVGRLRQVLLNLVGNAIKFTTTGGVAIIAEPGTWHDEITFAVHDTGIGIAPEAQGRIFREFEQADGSSTRKHGGTGLGLAISKRIVERMNGRIGLESRPGIGTSFNFTVALPRAADEEPGFSAPDLTHKSVLIVSPAAVEAPLLAERLGRWGARTCIVADEAVAAAVLPERQWDIALVDRALGRAALDRLLAAGLRGVARRIVMLTPAERHDLAALKDGGFTGYLIKPVRAASLAARVAGPPDTFEHVTTVPDMPTGGDALDAAVRARASRSVLVVEDNEINALLARALLSKLGHRPAIAGNGAAAVEEVLAANAAESRYDVVLMDVQMPDVDGIEAARRIRQAEADGGWPRVPIIALTANAGEQDRSACLAAGMDAVLVKPLDRERLAEALATVERSRAATG